MVKRLFSLINSILIVLSFSGCDPIGQVAKTQTYYDLFDSFVTISSYGKDTEEEFRNNCSEIIEKLEFYNKLFDIYNEYEGIKNLCTVNKKAGDEAVKVDPELIDFIDYSINICQKCNLEVNIAMGAVLSLWHDARVSANEKNTPYLPSEKSLEEAFLHTKLDSIVIDRKNSTIFISDPLSRIDVGAIAKGYAAQKAAEYLKTKNIDGYILNLGGNIVAIGEKSNGEGWITGITNPNKNSDKKFAAKIRISNVSCVTSGDYERYFSFEGKDYHHIIDKDTLYPAAYYKSVTVISKDSALSDALSTALFCMSLEEGKSLLESFDDVNAIWIFENGNIVKTEGVDIIAQ